MRVSSFYRVHECEDLAHLDSIIHENGRIHFLSNLIYEMSTMLVQGEGYENTLSKLKEKMVSGYEQAWFSFPWQLNEALEEDLFCLKRFFMWLGNVTFIASNVPIEVPVASPLPDGSMTLTDSVPLITQFQNGAYGAIILHFKCADKSLGGKTVHTAISTDLHSMCAKYALEKKYPGIVISNVYLRSGADADGKMRESFQITGTRISNVFSLTYDDYYTDGVFEKDLFLNALQEVTRIPAVRNCYECTKKAFCNISHLHEQGAILQNVRKTGKTGEKNTYQMPSFTKEQQKVVEHLNGPMMVCAGPGSGKTATLVGRVKRLLEKDIDPEFILVITFTNEAADELEYRCRSFCPQGSLPKISTINALGYEILRENADLIEGGVNLLSPVMQMSLVRDLLSVTPKLQGFKYGKEYGKNGLYKTVCSKLNKFLSCATPEAFLQEEPSLGSDFICLAKQYQEILLEHGFITFDEQVSLCNKLFKKFPSVLSIYQNIWKHIMVDEYQDISSEQAEFIYALAAHENLVVVGDDDQGIYGFRGGSNQFMLDFPKKFEKAETVILRDNFRSTQKLVDASCAVIKNNRIRIKKDIRGNKGQGMKPVLLPDCSKKTIETAIAECLSAGFSYGDIAILSTKNLPLEELHRQLEVPAVLAKSYLRQDALFLIAKAMLALHKNLCDDQAFYQLVRLFNVTEVPAHGQTLYTSFLRNKYPDVRNYGAYDSECPTDADYSLLRLISSAFFILDGKPQSDFFIENLAYFLNMEDSPSMNAMTELIETQQLHSTEQLADYMEYMTQFEDETKVELPPTDAVLLITSHESKGREFPVVLLINNFRDSSEETRRLFYVAMTRAKERLYILQDETATNHFPDELPELERRVI